MHDSPAKSFWDSLLSLFLPFEIAGGLGAVVTFVLWFVGLPAPVLYITGTLAFASVSIGLIGQVKHSREQPVISSGSVVPPVELPRSRKLRPQSNLCFLGIEYVNLYLDENEIYWEIRRATTRQVEPSYCAVLRFGNEPIAGRPGQPIRRLRAKLIFRDLRTGQEFPSVERGTWAHEKYNAIDLEVGDSRLLIVGFGLPYGFTNPEFVFTVSNTRYAENSEGEHIVHKIDSPRLAVDVRLIAGDGGYVVYDDSFELCTTPRIVLTTKTK
jgi:hypothetical protein